MVGMQRGSLIHLRIAHKVSSEGCGVHGSRSRMFCCRAVLSNVTEDPLLQIGGAAGELGIDSLVCRSSVPAACCIAATVAE